LFTVQNITKIRIQSQKFTFHIEAVVYYIFDFKFYVKLSIANWS